MISITAPNRSVIADFVKDINLTDLLTSLLDFYAKSQMSFSNLTYLPPADDRKQPTVRVEFYIGDSPFGLDLNEAIKGKGQLGAEDFVSDTLLAYFVVPEKDDTNFKLSDVIVSHSTVSLSISLIDDQENASYYHVGTIGSIDKSVLVDNLDLIQMENTWSHS